MTKHKKKPPPRILTAKDLILLATRIDPKTPVAIVTAEGAEMAVVGPMTCLGMVDDGSGEETACIVISSIAKAPRQ